MSRRKEQMVAHVCISYITFSPEEELTLLSFPERMTKILQTVGKPIVEASLSTFICMLPLFYVRTYIIVAFAKTVTLVATFGLLHGIVIIPVCLSFFPVRTKSPAARTSGHLEEQKGVYARVSCDNLPLVCEQYSSAAAPKRVLDAGLS
ncbi:hypothetical protein COOONC_07861 [Cooperia oncophora]